MKKKTAYLLLGIFLTTTVLGGCGKNEATEAASESAQTEKEGAGEDELTETPTPEAKSDKETNKQKSSKETETSDSDNEDKTEETTEASREKIAVLLPNEEKWTRDADEFKSTLEDDGYEPVIEYAENDVSRQVSQIQELTAEEVSAFVIAPVDPYGLKSVLESVKEAEIPVFSYDDLIMDTNAVKYYVTFGGRQIGQMIGKKIIESEELDKVREAKESRTIEFFMGSLDDTQALFLYNGLMETLQEYLDDGTLVCKSGKLSFDDTGILRWSKNTAKSRAAEILEQFYPDRMASRILGMGDVLTLIEKAEAQLDADKAKAMEEKLKKAEFDFNDFLEYMGQIKNMGGISSIMSMMPGLSGQMKNVSIDDDEAEKNMRRTESIIYSMTKAERSNPDILNPSRKNRIARGAGVDIADVNRLVKQFEQMKKMMKQMPGMMKGAKKGRFKLPF